MKAALMSELQTLSRGSGITTSTFTLRPTESFLPALHVSDLLEWG